ncbi:sigma-70 family RNA polymerase sigma factor [Mucilaginibacter sp. cycad4]|uniref:RNA polymerase sigma factor n=1 Tax=Mucilaginibacter sp. cycad4 TaxID=3342096 RepID=UPI002AAC0013|nr:sigma-70 family RNA polymerase sigma factor [Mucilaginibacter gossypii]WPV00719.1 sigma-70 family RNA polymerase sigma factor [Mucilaginibacter gossypii]
MMKNLEELSNLWSEVCIGNKRSYSIIHQNLYPVLYTLGNRMVNDEELTDDLIQEVFIKLWLRKESIGPIGNVKGYFFAVMRSVCLDFIRSKDLVETRMARIEFLDLQISIEDEITQKEATLKQRRMIEYALNRLPDRQQEIIRLRFFEGLTCAEIGSMTGIKYQSVVNHVYRAVQTLRELYGAEDELRVA